MFYLDGRTDRHVDGRTNSWTDNVNYLKTDVKMFSILINLCTFFCFVILLLFR